MNTREIADKVARSFGFDKNGFVTCDPAALMNAIDSALQQAIADERARQWQPIETAPRDGTKLLVFCETGIAVVHCFKPPLGSDRWLTVDGGYEIEPTHWQPLPPPPAIRRDSTGEEGS